MGADIARHPSRGSGMQPSKKLVAERCFGTLSSILEAMSPLRCTQGKLRAGRLLKIS